MRWQPLAEGALAVAAMLAVAGCASSKKPPAPSRAPAAATGAVKIGKPYVVFGKTYYPADDRNYDERGIASWYGPGFHALATANGEVYDQDDVTGAHKTLPMPSWAEVENLDNGRKLVVRINARGPFVDGRIIDLSRRSAQLLGVDRVGLAKVRVRRVFPAMTPGPVFAAAPAPAPISAPPVQTAAVIDPPVTTVALPGGAGAAPPAAPPPPSFVPSAPLGSRYVQVAALSEPGRIAWLKGFLSSYGPVVTQPGPSGLTRVRLGPFADEAAANTALANVRSAGYADARLVNP
ncbi:septal ring lytic transglycosylase RlpA family protein [Polymorphobacter multimanifer]|uniref:septal ring lytic transglycosylase RlpA family protein n=1 Tax=Polymorphobacter multimanifer TaxID=1070431 RepID=UPI0016629321|nr:septal ring lytic transglycosylase RlpA family protein [Polymorphobacter multimanifer]